MREAEEEKTLFLTTTRQEDREKTDTSQICTVVGQEVTGASGIVGNSC